MESPRATGRRVYGITRPRVTVAFLIGLLAAVAPAFGAIQHVDDDPNPCTPKTGTLACPYQTIQAAIDAAAVGDSVLVLPGTYMQ